MELRYYTIEDNDGQWDALRDDREQAVAEARARRRMGERCAVLALTFEYTDSELVDPDLESWTPGEDEEE